MTPEQRAAQKAFLQLAEWAEAEAQRNDMAAVESPASAFARMRSIGLRDAADEARRLEKKARRGY